MKTKIINTCKDVELNSSSLSSELDPLLLRVLISRGINTQEKVNSFLYDGIEQLASPFLLNGMKEAVDRISFALAKGQKITLFGDYDCDGIGAIAILYLTLSKLGNIPYYYIPIRHDEGYGLNIDAIERIKNTDNSDLIITVDCGISSAKEVEYANKLGIDVIVTDHHSISGDLPKSIIINPKLNPDYTQLCGAGVALKLSEALTNREKAMEYLDICAVSTIADIVPLVGDNRIIVKYGLKKLAKHPREGLKKLIQESKLSGEIDTYDVGFRIAPKLNAAGRLSNATKSLQLLLEEDLTAISLLVSELNKENENRQSLCEGVISEAKEMLKSLDLSQKYIIILHNAKWEEGVIGIAAAKITELFNRPTLLLSGDGETIKGSARSVSGINLMNVLSACKECFTKFGGHSMAAGVSMAKGNLSKLSEMANKYLASNTDSSIYADTIKYEVELPLEQANLKLIGQLEMLAPFGFQNPKLTFMTELSAYPFLQIGNYPHIKAAMKHGEIVAFNRFEELSLLKGNSKKLITYSLERTCFKNKEYVQAKIKDIYIQNPIVSEDELKEKYLRLFLLKNDNVPMPTCKHYFDNRLSSGILYIAFSIPKLVEMQSKYSGDIDVSVFSDKSINPYTKIVLMPGEDFDFSYYNKLVFLETPPSAFVKRIKGCFSGEMEYPLNSYPEYEIPFANITVEQLRNTFVFFHKNLNNVPFLSVDRLFKNSILKGYSESYEVFFISLYIFLELALINISEYGIIIINNNKSDLSKSKIFSFVNKSK